MSNEPIREVLESDESDVIHCWALIAAMDLFVAPTMGFDLLYVLVIIRLERRNLVWINVTPHPTAEWIARQVTEAFPWAEAPRYLIRALAADRSDQSFGEAFIADAHGP